MKLESGKSQEDRMKWVMFYVFLGLFVLAVLGTLGMVFLGFGTPTEEERSLLVKALIGEIAAAVVALFYSLFNLKGKKRGADYQQEIARFKKQINDLENELKHEREKNKLMEGDSQKTANEDSDQEKIQKRLLALFGQGNELNMNDLMRELYLSGYDNDQKNQVLEVIGSLVQKNIIEPAINRMDGYRLVKKY